MPKSLNTQILSIKDIVCKHCDSTDIDGEDPTPDNPTAYYRLCLTCGKNPL
ncbi:hypothetical protein LCGC14_0742340 [marine sediment metagenome]|uniref:Uncharacterized protein n=1 Tax=marine sediment metagenome TaxID=412755 RepID=A0A0F9SRF0_9ZZZZ